MEISEPIIYPEDEIFIEYFNKYSNAVFVAFNPFFRIKDEENNKSNYLSSMKVIPETKYDDKSLNYVIDKLGTNGKSIYFSNPEYPDSRKIIELLQ